MSRVLVVAGEASGDRAAAGVVARLVRERVEVFGMGGAASVAAGADLVARLEDATAMGFGDVVQRGVGVVRAVAAVLKAVRQRRPQAALLVNYSELNTLLARVLHRRGVRVLFYIAPQVWAWRPGRAEKLRGVVDCMAVILPFEEAIWRQHGIDAVYVGHPALEVAPLPRPEARTLLGLDGSEPAVALLAGSRPHEVKRLLPAMLEAHAIAVTHRAFQVRVLLASSLGAETAAWAREQASRRGVEVVPTEARTGALQWLKGFDAVLCASGTASLEASLARAIPVVAYRVGPLTALAARAFVSTPYFALPNVLLARRTFHELLQGDATASKMAEALAGALGAEREAMLAACDEVESILGAEHAPSEKVAGMILGWL